MRVLLLGATGNLGSRCLPALIAHKHIVTVFVRNPGKFRSLISPSLLAQVNAIVEGDVTDSAALKQAILDHGIEGIINVAGTQVKSTEEFLLPKIAKAVRDAAVPIGKQRGKPLRAWITSGLGILEYPGTKYLIQDYFPKRAVEQHQATRDVVEAIPLDELRWSLLAIAMMSPTNPKQGVFELLDAPQRHDLLVKATSPPGWERTWLGSVPLIGPYLNVFYAGLVTYRTKYEDVADFLADDLESGSDEWVGKKVGVKQKSKRDV